MHLLACAFMPISCLAQVPEDCNVTKTEALDMQPDVPCSSTHNFYVIAFKAFST